MATKKILQKVLWGVDQAFPEMLEQEFGESKTHHKLRSLPNG